MIFKLMKPFSVFSNTVVILLVAFLDATNTTVERRALVTKRAQSRIEDIQVHFTSVCGNLPLRSCFWNQSVQMKSLFFEISKI